MVSRAREMPAVGLTADDLVISVACALAYENREHVPEYVGARCDVDDLEVADEVAGEVAG
jgi:hypothetical protein